MTFHLMDLIQDGAVSIYPKIYVLKYLDNILLYTGSLKGNNFRLILIGIAV